MTAMRTNRPFAVAAIAHAAIPRSCGELNVAMRLVSPKQPFNTTDLGAFHEKRSAACETYHRKRGHYLNPFLTRKV